MNKRRIEMKKKRGCAVTGLENAMDLVNGEVKPIINNNILKENKDEKKN